jgi:rare lipoprotein A
LKKIKILLFPLLLAFATPAFGECGIASVYWEGTRTANGEHFNTLGISAAHRVLRFGTWVRVRVTKTGRELRVRINDRGPFIAGRIIDLSKGAARALGVTGLGHVCLYSEK